MIDGGRIPSPEQVVDRLPDQLRSGATLPGGTLVERGNLGIVELHERRLPGHHNIVAYAISVSEAREPGGTGRCQNGMRAKAALLTIASAALAAGCGQAAGGSSGGGSTTHTGTVPRTSPAGTITGVYRRGPGNTIGLHGVAGVRIGLYLRPIIHGPIMADPPLPVSVVMTTRGGLFAFAGLGSRRYFVSPIDGGAYAPGRWARPGGSAVVIVGCTDCAMPMAATSPAGG